MNRLLRSVEFAKKSCSLCGLKANQRGRKVTQFHWAEISQNSDVACLFEDARYRCVHRKFGEADRRKASLLWLPSCDDKKRRHETKHSSGRAPSKERRSPFRTRPDAQSCKDVYPGDTTSVIGSKQPSVRRLFEGCPEAI